MIGRRAHAFCLSAVIFVTGSTVCPVGAAQEAPPALTQPVNDFANVIDAGSEAEMDRRIRALLAATGDVVVVVTAKTFQPYATIDEFATRMFENGGRGIGQKGKDNGALIVAAMDDRKVRIEVGYDLEEFITDGYAGETIRQVILPQFRAGNYGPGLLDAVTRIVNRVAERRGVALEGVPATPRRAAPRQRPFPTWMIALVLWLLVLALTNRRRHRRHTRWGRGPWSGWGSGVGPFGGGSFGGGFGGFGGGGGGGGGFGGFGGGRSGGGGASGGW